MPDANFWALLFFPTLTRPGSVLESLWYERALNDEFETEDSVEQEGEKPEQDSDSEWNRARRDSGSDDFSLIVFD
ncbi:MAG: hypothetical protein L6R36_005596 [Xanthoria steineri]|nr:MAG: hypothetical protein L6R36_005596 [Xanthoria steineri]